MPLEQVPHFSHLVHLEVVYKHDLTRFQCWAQEELYVVQESFSIGGAIYAHRGTHPSREIEQISVTLLPVLGRLPKSPL